MWQRVQTLYLAVATALVAALFFCNKAVTVGVDGSVAEAFTYIDYIPYLILLVVISALEVLALTTFRHRIFQMRTAVLAALLCVALQGWLGVDFFLTRGEVVFRLSAVFPIAAAILDGMAARAIFADQMLVESAYHLRKSRRERRR